MRTTSKTNSKRIHKVIICLIIFTLGVSMLIGCTSNNNAEYELTVTIGGAGNGKVTGAGKFEVGETVVVMATVTAGYTFDGWYDGADKKSDSLEYTFAMPAKNFTLTAKFGADISSLSKGLKKDIDNPKKQTISKGDVLLRAMAKEKGINV